MTCAVNISNTVMWYLNRDPVFKLDKDNMEIERRHQEVT
jgi:hypothetical protein